MVRIHNPPDPEEVLKDTVVRKGGGIPVAQFADHLRISRTALARVVNARAKVCAELAIRLSAALGGTAESWLRMQISHDLWKARKKRGPKIERLRDRWVSYSSIMIEPFRAGDYLGDQADMVEYLAAAIEDRNPSVFLEALQEVVNARGLTAVATASGFSPRALEDVRARGARLPFEAVRKTITALGMRFAVTIS
jgi:addiction module HigA family antidote